MPQFNILLGYISGFLSVLCLHEAKRIGYDVPPDIASGLPVAIAVGIAHGSDLVSAWLASRKPKP